MSRLFLLVLGMFTVGSSSFMIAGLLPNIGATIHVPIAAAGQGITAFSLTYLISAPTFSMLFANKSAKKTLQLALLIFLAGNFITIISENISMFIIGRMITGLGAGIFNPLCVSIAVHLGPQESKGKVLSMVWGANSAGVVFGVPFAIWLASILSWQWSIGYVFATGLITLIGFSLQKVSIELPKSSNFLERFKLLVDKKVLAVVGITCLTAMASLGLYSYVSAILANSSHPLSAALFFWGIGGFIGSSSVGHFIDKTKKSALIMAVILLGLGLTFLSLPLASQTPYSVLLILFFWGAFGWAMPTPQQHVLFEVNEKQRALLSALNSSAIGLGSTLGTAGFGTLIALGVETSGLPMISAIVIFITLGCQLILVKQNSARKVCYDVASTPK